MSMYRPYSNVAFNNCYDFITKSKAEKEVWELSTSLTFDDKKEMRWELDRISDLAKDIMNAEYDLCEMEMDASYDAEEYDSIMNGNTFRKGHNRKVRQNGKRNAKKAKRLHDSDRKHGKPVPQSDKKYWDEQSGTFYRWDEKRKTFNSHKKPIIHKKRKTFRDRLNSAMSAREKEYISAFSEKGELMNKVLPTIEDNIIYLEKCVKNLEHEKAYSYITEKGKGILDEYEELLPKCEDYKKDILRVINTATR